MRTLAYAVAAVVLVAWGYAAGLNAANPPPPRPRLPTPTAAELAVRWYPIGTSGDCPLTHPLKANVDSGVYHLPDGASYGRTRNAGVRCYRDTPTVEQDGFRAALR